MSLTLYQASFKYNYAYIFFFTCISLTLYRVLKILSLIKATYIFLHYFFFIYAISSFTDSSLKQTHIHFFTYIFINTISSFKDSSLKQSNAYFSSCIFLTLHHFFFSLSLLGLSFLTLLEVSRGHSVYAFPFPVIH